MVAEADQWSLFGLDLRQLGRHWCNGWEEALSWPLFAWLSPPEAVRVHLPDGSTEIRRGVSARRLPPASRAQAEAVLLDDDIVLVRELRLPLLGWAQLRQAVALEVTAVSPFPETETVWGWSSVAAQDHAVVRLALAGRQHVQAALARVGKQPASVEVWADAAAPLLIEGFGESQRLGRMRAVRQRTVLAVCGLAVLLAAVVATPVLQARERTFDAQRQFGALEAEVTDLVIARATLNTRQEQLQAVQDHLADRVDIPLMLEALTAALPDDAYLARFDLNGRQLRITGQADNASSLMSALGAPGSAFRDVRAPSPISRQPGSNKDNFVIELQLDAGDATGVRQ
ncbi:MAG: PilN domain-containing protein [Thauera sp.]|jgi:general secretion pathway protein L|nr:PilN domain-containing protein [Thauera sp.]